MRALGVDVGTAITGWGVVEKDSINQKLTSVAHGAITTKADTPMPERLEIIFNELCEVIDTYQPEEMGVESLFLFKNQKTVISVGQARGVILLSGRIKRVPIFDYTPLQVKTAVTGYGRAEKKQIQKMIKLLLKLEQEPKPDDVADALAVAICHIHSRRTTDLLPEHI